MKELVSYRQWNLMDQGKLLEVVKENTCFLSQTDQEFDANLKTCKWVKYLNWLIEALWTKKIKVHKTKWYYN